MSRIFISYQRESEPDATEVNHKLKAAGFDVWQDIEKIRHTDFWPLAIDAALQNADRLILLLTPKSVNSREVFAEWFYFYKHKRPIHCLLVENCDPPHHIGALQYLDWRSPRNRDWERLIRELDQPFIWSVESLSDKVVNSDFAPKRTDVEAADALLQAVRDQTGVVALNDEQIKRIIAKRPLTLTDYRLSRIAEWSQPRYRLDQRFVELSLLLDQGEDAEGHRWLEDQRYNDLNDILTEVDASALVILGVPGSGKSTMLRRLELVHAVEQIRSDGSQVTFFIQLSEYASDSSSQVPSPLEWLSSRWENRYPELPTLSDLLNDRCLILLLDAVNEMPHENLQDYHTRINLWKQFLREEIRDKPGNRVIFSCRSLDYGAPLSRFC